MSNPLFFTSASEFRAWLTKNHRNETELLVAFYKKDSGKKSITYPEALDEALCFGWIDGVRRSLGADAYTTRFSPRTSTSTWSLINIAKARALLKEGSMRPAGLKAFQARDPKRSGIYSFENRPKVLDRATQRTFKANARAWKFFQAQPPGYRRTAIFMVMSAKKEETRARRLAQLIDDSGQGRRLTLLTASPRRAR